VCWTAKGREAQMPAHLTPAEKSKMNDKAVSVIILCLRDKLLREVAINFENQRITKVQRLEVGE
jgi:hypothetical protein